MDGRPNRAEIISYVLNFLRCTMDAAYGSTRLKKLQSVSAFLFFGPVLIYNGLLSSLIGLDKARVRKPGSIFIIFHNV